MNNKELEGVIRFAPYYKPVIWGGKAIGRLKGVPMVVDNIGESWEISGVPGHESVVAEGPLKGLNIALTSWDAFPPSASDPLSRC